MPAPESFLYMAQKVKNVAIFMAKKKKNAKKADDDDNPYMENLIKLIAKTLKDNFNQDDVASIMNDFGINIKLSVNPQSPKLGQNGSSNAKGQDSNFPEGLPQELPLANEPFVETIYKKDNVVINASIPDAKKEEINVIASQSSIIIEVSHNGMVFNKKIQLDANIDPEKGSATFKTAYWK